MTDWPLFGAQVHGMGQTVQGLRHSVASMADSMMGLQHLMTTILRLRPAAFQGPQGVGASPGWEGEGAAGQPGPGSAAALAFAAPSVPFAVPPAHTQQPGVGGGSPLSMPARAAAWEGGRQACRQPRVPHRARTCLSPSRASPCRQLLGGSSSSRAAAVQAPSLAMAEEEEGHRSMLC